MEDDARFGRMREGYRLDRERRGTVLTLSYRVMLNPYAPSTSRDKMGKRSPRCIESRYLDE